LTIRWRISIAAVQLLTLAVGTLVIFGSVPVDRTWFISGLLAIVVNRQLLEPYYPRPADVLANSVVALAIWLGAERVRVEAGWTLLLALYMSAAAVAVVALVLGASRTGSGARVGNAAALVSHRLTAQALYSALFFVSLLEDVSPTDGDFWAVTAIWAVTIAIGSLPLNRLWIGLRSPGDPVTVVGLVGPARLLVKAPTVPPVGEVVNVRSAGIVATAVVASRVRRVSDIWAELQLGVSSEAEQILVARVANLTAAGQDDRFIGVAEEGSTVDRLVFVTAAEMLLGDVVAVEIGVGEVLFQVVEAQLERRNVKGGSQVVIRVAASQLGRFEADTCRIERHSWIAQPGSFVRVPDLDLADIAVPAGFHRLGCISNTKIPVFVDLAVLCEGHAAVLGMTKMGKTTLAHRVATAVAETRRTVIFDGTGQYRTKLNVPAFDKAEPWTQSSLSVLEPPPKTHGADFALKCIEKLVELAGTEYSVGEPTPRSLLFEEAHDYFPEPASLGFNAPGRDASYKLGTLMMQVRKFGLSLLLVSQRTAVVSKSALSQCENLIVFRSVDRTGLDYLEEVSGGNVRKLIPSLAQGQAVVFGPAMSADAPVAIDVEFVD
jgi:hypothetical protein